MRALPYEALAREDLSIRLALSQAIKKASFFRARLKYKIENMLNGFIGLISLKQYLDAG